MSVIKTLDASENNDEREREKLKIEREFKKSDKRLQELVSRHDSELTKVRNLINFQFIINVNSLTSFRHFNFSQKSHLKSIFLVIEFIQFVRIFKHANNN